MTVDPPKAKFLVAAAVGSGGTALAAERGGADMVLALNAGRFRTMGAPSIACMLPIRDASAMTERFAREELLPQCRIPVYLGSSVWGADLDPVERARELRDLGFAGMVNFPSCMHYPRAMQQILSRAGRGIESEVAQLRAAQDAGMSSIFYCATRTQARLAADAKLDFVCLNLGWNAGGAIGHRVRAPLDEVATAAREIGRLVKRISPSTRFLLEGGPIATPEDLGRVISIAPVDGYIGGSTIERMPFEVSVADQIDGFRQAGNRRAALDRASAQLVGWSQRMGFAGRSAMQLTFLRRLRDLSGGAHPILVIAEDGTNEEPILTALGSHKEPGRKAAVAHVDCGELNVVSRARNVLFGHRDTADRRQPVLSDPDVAVLAIHAPENLSAGVQNKLARALTDGAFRVPGGGRSLPVVPRVVLLTRAAFQNVEGHPDATSLQGELRQVFSGWTLGVPPLRDRSEDIFPLMQALALRATGTQMQKAHFTSAALKMIHAHTWPGNDRELTAMIGALAGRVQEGPVQPKEVAQALNAEPRAVNSRQSEKERVVDALWRNGFSRTRTADALGVSRKTLYNKMRKFNLLG